jgi:NADPH:quinone reductase-like Zn-dependent oxidoreductase
MPGLLAKVNTSDLNFLAGLMQSGKVTPVLDRSYALRETADAVRYVEQLHARGKVVLSVS